MLKRLALVFSLVAALGIGGGAIADSASAASCTPSASPYVYSSTQIGTQFTLNCSGVEEIVVQTAGTGWFDNTWGGGLHVAYNFAGTHDDIAIGGDPSNPIYSAWFHLGCWYSGTHNLSFLGKYKMKNSVTHTYGVWQYYQTNAFNWAFTPSGTCV